MSSMNEMQSMMEIMMKKLSELELKTKIQESEIRILKLKGEQTNQKLKVAEEAINNHENQIADIETDAYEEISMNTRRIFDLRYQIFPDNEEEDEDEFEVADDSGYESNQE